MRPAIKKYIENNINIIETDLERFFYLSGNTLTESGLSEVIDILEQSGIATTYARINALNKYLTHIFQSFDRDSLDGEPLKAYLEEYLSTYMGFDLEYVISHVLDNQKIWTSWITFERINHPVTGQKIYVCR